MPIDRARATEYLRDFAFRRLFVDELGWDNPASRHSETVTAEGATFALEPVAEKRGVRIFHCADIPERPVRQRIEREVTKLAYEHLIIFSDPAKTRQVWQWVAREKGKPAAFREHLWLTAQSPEPLLQKLDHIAFSLEEEEGLTLAGATVRMRDAFDRERITKRFYEAFKQQHDQFLGFITGLTSAADKAWYASLMLNRLMFVYFIQKKRFLDGDIDYLKNRLAKVRAEQGQDQFHSFYRAFLLKLFHGGLATPKDARDAETARLIGNIPYLNGGLFEPHALEGEGNTIQIGDAAFESIFAFFDQYEWTLDTRAIERADGCEINPDVLGHIFEKYINQKQMGAYYTKEDITDYITRSTVIPWLFRNAESHDKVAFEPGGAVWRMLSESPDTYIFKSVKHGADQPLPNNIAAGIGDVAARGDWNRTASAELGLPTETWREVVARRERYESVKARAAAGEICAIEDLITHNLDIRQFALDAIQFAESPDLVRAFWKGISAVKVLDPACGSGAFLFAALNILYDLYDACLERMEEFVQTAPEGSGPRQLYSDFREVLARIARHPSRPYFIYKSIILDNLYGVDIMDEAVEICKLRLFLKLAAQLESADQIEPLPDIDFNIRAGNSVLGFKSIKDALDKSTKAGLQFDDSLADIQAKADDLDSVVRLFRRQQTELGGSVTSADKLAVREKMGALEQRLNKLFVDLYAPRRPVLGDVEMWEEHWLASQKPFHWVIDFHEIVEDGGFSVIIGNPPYVEIDPNNSRKALLDEYDTCLDTWSRDEDLYTLFVERSLAIASPENSSMGLILPLSVAFSTKRPFMSLRQIIARASGSWYWSHYDRIPSSLFGNDVRTRCSIGLWHSQSADDRTFHTTSLMRWGFERREVLFDGLVYALFSGDIAQRIPKVANDAQAAGLAYLLSLNRPLGIQLGRSISATALASEAPRFPRNAVFVAGTAYNWFPAWRSIPPTTDERGRAGVPARTIGFQFESEDEANATFALLCSSLGYWWWAVASDGFNLKKWLIESFPLSANAIAPDYQSALAEIGAELKECLESNYVYKDNKGRKGNYFLPACSHVTERIDQLIDEALTGIDADFIQSVQEFNATFSQSNFSASEVDAH
ncbi:site-specific DNA-methyltransferase (adenine-specific) [Altererythrobacter aerius]|uniref:site-specific DNA-methyltransferase (adenine-specific) n=1 Tax=Tsuneonella aeria TaxID=1837929 RepID=A0A6I4TI54_9SPHN|nr:DNA methyltransferase [Tsuneonella aeria]MXO75735.1 site-specific DNA-methyltransferase (adenine-specific) [Tsuneonella aeria]